MAKKMIRFSNSEYGDFFRAVSHKSYLTMCHHRLNKFWKIDGANEIELVLVDKPVDEALKVEMRDGNFLILDGVEIASTFEQDDLFNAFIDKHGACFAYINILTW